MVTQSVSKRITKRECVFNKYGGRCAYCGCKIQWSTFTVDHIYCKNDYKKNGFLIPNGMSLSDMDNLNPSCASCNSYKCYFSLEEFRENLENEYFNLLNIPKVKVGQRF